MKKIDLLIVGTLLAFAGNSVCEAEDWQKYFSNRAGYDYFIEKDSLVKLQGKQIRVWHKETVSEGVDPSDRPYPYVVTLELVDCISKKRKVLEGEAIEKGKLIKLAPDTTWSYLKPGDLYESFFQTVCGFLD